MTIKKVMATENSLYQKLETTTNPEKREKIHLNIVQCTENVQ